MRPELSDARTNHSLQVRASAIRNLLFDLHGIPAPKVVTLGDACITLIGSGGCTIAQIERKFVNGKYQVYILFVWKLEWNQYESCLFLGSKVESTRQVGVRAIFPPMKI